MATKYYQIYAGKEGIEKAVARASKTVAQMPMTGWITQQSASQSGCLALWTQEGLLRYAQSGLLGWQCRLLKPELRIRELHLIGEPAHLDQHQLIAPPQELEESGWLTATAFFERLQISQVRHQVVVYVTRSGPRREDDLLVFQGEKVEVFSVPMQEIQPNEHPAEASYRSLCQSSGIDGQIQFRRLGTNVSYDPLTKDFLIFHYFQSPLHTELPESWDFQASSRRPLHFSWIPLTKAKICLSKVHAAKLDRLEAL